jgi:uncharacterized protein YjbJ (UPF0337 family)
MNWDSIEGGWKQFKGKARQKWGRLTDGDLDKIGGKKDELVGTVQRVYGKSKEEADKECEDFARECRA